jgi:acetyl esterase/lipase
MSRSGPGPQGPLRRLLAPAVVAALIVALSSCVVPPSSRDASPRSATPPTSVGWVEYAPALRGDLYLPRAGGRRGTIVLLHGGGFITGSRAEIVAYADAVMRQLDRGFAVLAIDYRLTTDSKNFFPAAVTDASAAVDWVRSEGAAYGAPNDTVVLAGHSAGATIASLVAMGANSPGTPRGTTSPVDGWIGISGTYDLRGDGIAALQRAVWLGPGATPETVDSASAVTLADAADPPAYLVHGRHDGLVPLEQTQRLWVALGAVGTDPWIDVVGDAECDGHVPTCAINHVFLDGWIDRVAARG